MPTPNNDNALTIPAAATLRAIEPSAWNAMKELYDGASETSLALVFDYCKARQLDPLKKPVHIVSVWSNRRKAMVETIWASIAEARITAMRTGLYAGKDDTLFGPSITAKVGRVDLTYPEWAQVTVKRLVSGQAMPFAGPKVRWLETYSRLAKDDASPNAMWAKRTFGQLEKCAEAAALRVAFPEEFGGTYTAEEMEGKVIDENQEDTRPATVARLPIPPKNKGAAAMKNVTPEASFSVTPGGTTTIPGEPGNAQPHDQPGSAPAPEPAGATAGEMDRGSTAAESQARKPAIASPAVPQPDGWPKHIEGKIKSQKEVEMTIEAARAGPEGLIPAKKLPTIIMVMDSPEAKDTALEVAGEVKVIISPYAVESIAKPHPLDPGEPKWDELPKGLWRLTIERWPSLTQPGKHLNVAVAIKPAKEEV